MAKIEMYSANWCSDCRRSKSLLDTLGVDYELFDVEQSKENADKSQAISGKTSIPVIRFEDGKFLVEPTDATLHAELKVRGILD